MCTSPLPTFARLATFTLTYLPPWAAPKAVVLPYEVFQKVSLLPTNGRIYLNGGGNGGGGGGGVAQTLREPTRERQMIIPHKHNIVAFLAHKRT